MAIISKENGKSRKLVFAICFLLALLTWLVFGQTLGFDFTNYDDPLYVTGIPQVTSGITANGVAWAFTHSHAWNWHPLTTISHMLDCQFYGLRPGPHHATNVLLHTLGVVLLFLVLREMTGMLWRSAFVAALFAIHPLRVESVAWISERKDVLSGVFFMLTLAAYLRYVRKPATANYLLLGALFTLGLMSKPMLVTVPVVLLVLDYWPLQRFTTGASPTPSGRLAQQSLWRLVVEKLPLLVFSVAVCWITMVVQQAAASTAQVRFPTRLINAVLSCGAYIYQMFWPVKLAPFYPYRVGDLSIWVLLGVVVLLGLITVAVIRLRKEYPYAFTGWFWYLAMVVPVIGIVRVGAQAQADRYTYLPQIGLYLAFTWIVSDLTTGWRHRRVILGIGAATVVIMLAGRAWWQTGYWKNSESLWTRTLAITKNNALAHNNLGSALADNGRITEAIPHYEAALKVEPRFALAHRNYAKALFQKGDLEKAIFHWQECLSIFPEDAEAHTGLGDALQRKGLFADAAGQYEKSLQLAPDAGTTLNNYALLLATCSDQRLRNGPRAVQLAEQADQLAHGKNPLFARTLAVAYAEAGRFNDAIATAQRALPLAAAKRDSALVTTLRLDIDLYRINLPVR